MFQRCYVVTLQRRPDRYERFVSGLPADWPFPRPEKFEAIDGSSVPHPDWWRQGTGAWGCYRSHMSLIERCLNEGVESVLLLEDDAVFPNGFSAKAVEFMNALPEWDMVYLGGQLLKTGQGKPRRISDLVYQPFNVNRTHAFGVRGRDFMGELYKYLHDWRNWKHGHHIDHHFGALHQSGKCRVFCPGEWLVGQAEGPSDIKAGQKVFPERFWPGAVKAVSADAPPPVADPMHIQKHPFIAVLGLHSSGSSATAGVLYHLGAFLGEKLTGYYGRDPERDCGFEAAALARICESAIPFPKTEIVRPLPEVTEDLRRWIDANTSVALARRVPAAGKYPMLCRLGPQLLEATGNHMKVVHIDRPLEESIASLQRRCSRRDPEQLAAHQRWLWEGKQGLLATLPPADILTITYDRLLNDTHNVVRLLASFSGLQLTEERLRRAVASVDPKKRHIGS